MTSRTIIAGVLKNAIFASLAGCLVIIYSSASAFELEASIALGEIYTSNVTLADQNEQEEWVTRLVPNVIATHVGERFEYDVDYSLEALFFADESDLNEVFSNLNSTAGIDVIGEELKLRGFADINQVNLQPERPLGTTNINRTGNRSDLVEWDVGPNWQSTFFRGSEVDIYYYYGKLDYDDPARVDADKENGRFQLRSRPDSSAAISYEIVADREKYDYGAFGDIDRKEAFLRLGYRLNPEFRLIGLAGLDSEISDASDSSLDEGRWEVGFEAATAVDQLVAAVGHRYFGTTYRFSWIRESTDRSYRISYRETPSTTELQRPGDIGRNALTIEEIPDSGIERPGTGDAHIRKRGDAAITWKLYKSQLTTRVWWEERENLRDPNLALTVDTDDDESFGLAADFRWEVGLRSLATIEARWSRREFSTTPTPGMTTRIDDDDLYLVDGSIFYELGQKTSVTFGGSLQSRSGSGTDFVEYDEFQVYIELIRSIF